MKQKTVRNRYNRGFKQGQPMIQSGVNMVGRVDKFHFIFPMADFEAPSETVDLSVKIIHQSDSSCHENPRIIKSKK